MAKKKNLADNAQLIQEWDWDKNVDVDPRSLASWSTKKVWWVCKQGHSYQSPPARRSAGQGCPYCAGREAITGENDLQTLFPKIAEQWHYSKNQPLLPSQVKPKSNRVVWWVCDKGHEYAAGIQYRTRGDGCPYCSNHRVVSGYNDLKTINPQLASEWHPYKNGNLTPEMVTPSGDTVVWWKCSVCEYEWQVSLNRRRGCPRCSAKRTTSFPEQAMFFYVSQLYPDTINGYKYHDYELDVYIPSINTAVEYDGAFYHKSEHPRIKDEKKDELCKKDGIRLIRIRDPLLPATQYAEIIHCVGTHKTEVFEKALKQLLYLLDKENTISVNIERDWMSIEEKNLRFYAGNSLCDKYPEIAEEWNYEKNGLLTPRNFTPHSNRKVWWKCKNGHEWEAQIGSRTRGCNCPYCSGRKVTQGVNDLMALRPELVKEWNYEKNGDVTPDKISVYSNVRVWWKCSICQAEWQSTVSNKKQLYCHTCKRKLQGEKVTERAIKNNNLALKRPDIAKQWHPIRNGDLSPDIISCGAGKKVWWLCEKGHEWQSSVGNRTKDNLGCPYCGNQKVLEGFNDLSTTHPEIAEEWNYEKNTPKTPNQFVAGSGKTVWWKCRRCGNEWEAPIRNRTKGSKCPVCKKQKNKNPSI